MVRIALVFLEVGQRFDALGSQHGLMSISAVLKNNGFRDVRLFHFVKKLDFGRWRNELTEYNPALIGFYLPSCQMDIVRKMIAEIPYRGAFTICGGPHPTCFPESIEEIRGLDAMCVGEGEYAMLELAQSLNEGKDPTTVAGLWVRHNGKIVRNKPCPFIANLDELPYGDRDLFDTQHSIDAYGLEQIRVLASRGCPYRCTYCYNYKLGEAQPGRYVRFRSTDHLLGELKMLKSRFRFKEVFFDDDVFMLDKKRLAEFAERYPQEVGVPFVFSVRVEVCDRPTIQLLKKAGARRIDMGVETGNEELRRKVLRRPMSDEKILETAAAAREAGLQIKTLNMVGLPGETPEMHMDTVRINRQIRPTIVGLSVFTPFPGTDLYETCVKEGYLSSEEKIPYNVSYHKCILRMPQFTAEQIHRCYTLFGIRVFWRQSKIKALGYTILYSDIGKFLLNRLSGWKRYARALLKGF
jgi:radical SAM superfamily enzyme YgiQ (UPF0313 family)